MEVVTEPAKAKTHNGEQSAARGWVHWLPRIAAAVLIPVILLGMLECGLCLFGFGFPTDVTVPCTVKGQPASCYNLFFPAPFFPPGMIKTPQAYSIPAVKPPGTYRIFVLGESAAMGDPDPAYAFSRYLEVMLRQKFPGINFEVVNTGSVAINSHVALAIAEGLAKQKPDLFIIYSGNNEVVGPYGPGTALTSSISMSLPLIRSEIFFRATRTGELLTKIGTQKKEWGGMEMFMENQVPAASPLMRHVYSNFESNLRDTIKAAQASGARVIVSTVATNLKDCAPFASMHREGLSPEQLSAWSALVRHGAELESTRDFAEALKAYTAATRIDDQYAELEFRIARSLWASGKYGSAREHYARARDLDTLRFRADSRINDINRSVASSTGPELVDGEEIFSKQSANGIIGSDLVYEHVHMTPEGNYLLAQALFRQIATKLALQTGVTVKADDIPSQADCERLLALTPHDRLRMTTEMLQRLQRPPFTNQLNHSDQILRLTFQASVLDENPAETLVEYQWAIAQHPNDRPLHYNYGLFLFEHDRKAAAEQLRLAQPWDGFPVFAPDGTLIN
ncbi:MAG TPA: bacterial transcriptional activator domain-containing protein [Terriglobales bacterium]|nr:bacterial transcriptional activator domain-containing protein [Terriglobales bacterium]